MFFTLEIDILFFQKDVYIRYFTTEKNEPY